MTQVPNPNPAPNASINASANVSHAAPSAPAALSRSDPPTEEARPITIWWEDLQPGTQRDLGSLSPTAEEIIAFARQFDPQPFHLTEAGGQASLFGGLCASGWHTCSMAMRLMVTNFLSHSSSLGSPGMDNLRWLKPVYPGDLLSLTQHILESRPMASRPDVGLIRSQWKMVNQHGQPVMQMEGYGMFRRRHPAAPA